MRYVFMGNVYGFRSSLLGFTMEPFPVTFLSFPETVETLNLRQKPRVSCHIPATAELRGLKLKGVITDISAVGTRFSVIISEMGEIHEVNVDDHVNLSFPLIGMEGLKKFQGKVKNVTRDSKKLSFGVQFENLDAKVADSIDAYVKNVFDYQNL